LYFGSIKIIIAAAAHLLFATGGALVVSRNFVTVFCSIPGKQMKVTCFRLQILVVSKKKQE